MTQEEEEALSSQGGGTAHPEGWGGSPASDEDRDRLQAATAWARTQMDQGFPEEVVLETLVAQGWPHQMARGVVDDARRGPARAGAEGAELPVSPLGALWDETTPLDAYSPRRRRHWKVVLVTIIVLGFSVVLAIKFADFGISVSEQQGSGLTEEAITATVEAIQDLVRPPP